MIVKDSGGGSFEKAPAGTHVARCYKLVDIGTTMQEYQGERKKRHQVLIGWELPNELMTSGEFAGKPFSASSFYTLSLHEKAKLRHDLTNWRGRDFTEVELKGFDLKNILGAPCMISLTANDKGRTDVSAIMALPKGTTVSPPVNPPVYFSFDEFDQAVFDSFSDRMKAMIEGCDEYKALQSPQSGQSVDQYADNRGDGFTDDEIPF